MWIKPEDNQPTDTYVPVNKVTLMDLHVRYWHISFDTLKSLPEGQIYYTKATPKCEAYIGGKSTKPAAKSYKQKTPRSNQLLERIHADLIGPFTKEWLVKKYTLVMMDDYS